jgi:hypothetical protein
MCGAAEDVRFGPKADIRPIPQTDVFGVVVPDHCLARDDMDDPLKKAKEKAAASAALQTFLVDSSR